MSDTVYQCSACRHDPHPDHYCGAWVLAGVDDVDRCGCPPTSQWEVFREDEDGEG